MSPPAFVAVEVWLGPMEGLRCVAPAGNATATIHIGRVSLDKKTNTKNEFVLSYGHGVSSTHAELRFERGRLFLKDAGSTNGTSIQSGHVTGEVEIRSGDVFLVSSTPVRVRLVDAPLPEMPFPRVLRGEAWPDPAVQSIMQGAREAAVQRGELFTDTRHLCDSILRSRSASIQRILRDATWSREQALTELWEGRLFAGAYTWLNDLFLQPIGLKTGSDELILSPKVGFLIEEAQRNQVESSAVELETSLRHELLAMLRRDTESAVGSWLARRLPDLPPKEKPKPSPSPASPRPSPPAAVPQSSSGQIRRQASQKMKPMRPDAAVDRVVDLLTRDEKTPKAGSLPPVDEAGPEQAHAPAGPGAALVGAPLTEEEIALDRKARELGDALLRESAAYRFSTPADRREALRSLVVRELHALQPARRPRVLEQLRLQFPVVAPGDVPNLEELRLRRRVAELEKRLAEAVSRPAAAASKTAVAASLPWRILLTKDDDKAQGLEPRLAVVRDVLRFAQDVETFVLGLVEAMTMPGAETASFRLPNFRDRLSGFLATAAEGKEVNPDDVSDYLAELRRWQIAISAGHHEAPKLWFTKLWKRISPAVIEAGKPGGAGWKLRGETAEWWNQYRDLVKDLNPDLVQDQVLQAAAHFSQTEYDKLNKRK